MPSHQDRIRAKNPEMNCKHYYAFFSDTNISPFIEENGDRTTVATCIYCGFEYRYTRLQEKFESELEDFGLMILNRF